MRRRVQIHLEIRGRVMRQMTYVSTGVLEWREAPEPTLQSPQEAIVRPFIAARCDGDTLPLFSNVTRLMKFASVTQSLDPIVGDVLGEDPFKGPFAFGHECVAEVLECGEDVRSVAKGDKVIVPWAISCGYCFNCNHGLTSKCTNAGKTAIASYGFGKAMGPWGGVVSDKVRVPYADAMLVAVPATLDPLAVASASDNIPDAWRTVGPHLRRYPGAPVLIVGGRACSIGLYAAGIAVAMGSSRVDYLDTSRSRLEIAEELGANAVEIPPRSGWLQEQVPINGGPYLISVDANISAGSLNYALRSLAPGGICTGVGYYFPNTIPLPLIQMYVNSSTLHVGVSNPRADLPAVLELMQTGCFRPEKVTTLVASWDDAPEAFLQRTTKVAVKRDPLY